MHHRTLSAPKALWAAPSPRNAYRWLGIFVAVYMLHYAFSRRQSFTVTVPAPSSPVVPEPDHQPLCDSPELRERLEDIMVILKSGANEALAKLPVHFNTTLACVPHYAVFSDLEERIDGHQVYDALEDVDPEIKATHQDFIYYNRLQAGGRDAFSAEELAQWSSSQNTVSGRDTPGWKLDKWKFLPMAVKAYSIQPDAKWYWFLEADAFVLWDSLLEWLSQWDENESYYMGMQMAIGDVIFAYGGAGFAISNPAMRKLVGYRQLNLISIDEFTGNHWAGDCVLGKALSDAGVPLQYAWPTTLSDSPSTLNFAENFGGSQRNLWCHHAVSYHHLSPSDIMQVSEFEQRWNQENSTLLRHRDVFRYYVYPRLASERSDWDNLSEDVKIEDTTLESCRSICESEPTCIQFSMTGRVCKTSATVKLGSQHLPPSEGDRMVSGWLMDRVDMFMQNKDASCQTDDWVTP